MRPRSRRTVSSMTEAQVRHSSRISSAPCSTKRVSPAQRTASSRLAIRRKKMPADDLLALEERPVEARAPFAARRDAPPRSRRLEAHAAEGRVLGKALARLVVDAIHDVDPRLFGRGVAEHRAREDLSRLVAGALGELALHEGSHVDLVDVERRARRGELRGLVEPSALRPSNSRRAPCPLRRTAHASPRGEAPSRRTRLPSLLGRRRPLSFRMPARRSSSSKAARFSMSSAIAFAGSAQRGRLRLRAPSTCTRSWVILGTRRAATARSAPSCPATIRFLRLSVMKKLHAPEQRS